MKKYFTAIIAIVFISAFLSGCLSNKRTIQNEKKSVNTANTVLTEEDTNKNILLSQELQSLVLKDNFMESKDGHDFQIASWKFAKAFLSGNVNLTKSFVINPELKVHFYNTENLFSDLEFMILKLSPKNIEDDYINAEYEFQLNGEDSYTYLYFEMKKVNGEWRVQYFGLEK